MPLQWVPKCTDAEKLRQFEAQREIELTLLRRKYDILQAEQTQSQLTGIPKLNKALKVVRIFQNEYENLLTNLKVATAPGNVRKDSIQFNHLNDILSEYEVFNDKIKEKKMHLAEIEDQIKNVKKRVQELKKNMISDVEYQIFIRNASRTQEALENKLEVETRKFNEIVGKNLELRVKINTLLGDRNNFVSLFEKFIDKLTTGKYIMLDLIEQASLAYDQRNEWSNKLQMLRIKAQKDLNFNVDQMRRYKQKVDQGQQRDMFYIIKGQKRVMKDLMQKEALKRHYMKQNLEEKLKAYTQMMAEIKEFTKISQFELVALKYYQQEGKNFSDFEYVIASIKEMEFMSDELGKLQLEIDEEKQIHEYRGEKQSERLAYLEAELEETRKRTLQVEQSLDDVNSHLDQLISGVWRLFNLCKCKQDPLLQLLNDNSVVKDYNIILYLQVLENRIEQHLVSANYRSKERKSSTKLLTEPVVGKIYGIDRIVNSHPCALCLEHEMVVDVSDTAHIVWSKEVAKEKLKLRLALPDALTHLHTLSKCHLPQSRRLLQQRYI